MNKMRSDSTTESLYVMNTLKQMGFRIPYFHQEQGQNTYSTCLPKHQVEWLRAYAHILYCGALFVGTIASDSGSHFYCKVIFTLKEPSQFPQSDAEYDTVTAKALS
jgi:hypothetical protein